MLRAAYLVNIVILAPVVLATLLNDKSMITIFEGKFDHARELRIMVGAMWAGILVCSMIGLFFPREMLAVLVLQVVYKALFFGLVIAPAAVAGGLPAIPIGLSITFAMIICVYPFLIWRFFGP